jgi:hypothetical protein
MASSHEPSTPREHWTLTPHPFPLPVRGEGMTLVVLSSSKMVHRFNARIRSRKFLPNSPPEEEREIPRMLLSNAPRSCPR